eukprot:scaffold803_cov310-Pinguiococcus_pyrenoidosus.AAC.179
MPLTTNSPESCRPDLARKSPGRREVLTVPGLGDVSMFGTGIGEYLSLTAFPPKPNRELWKRSAYVRCCEGSATCGAAQVSRGCTFRCRASRTARRHPHFSRARAPEPGATPCGYGGRGRGRGRWPRCSRALCGLSARSGHC